ncbi:MAG TPA: hypothetical protein VFJ57_02480 [Solirubrobacterales bacterium]|nr:hypothetical protein [Solirubrobacterales bacterium]
MRLDEIDRELQRVDRAPASVIDRLELGPAEAALLEAIVAEPALDGAPDNAALPWPSARRRRLDLLGLAGTAAAAMAVAVLLLFGGGASKSPSEAYGAEVVRFAESTPLLLLEGPGWRVQNVTQQKNGDGSMEFVTGKPIPYERLTISGRDKTRLYVSGMFPPAVRQRKVELNWRRGSVPEWVATVRQMPHPHGQLWVKAPVLETRADVDTRAESYVNQGGPGNRQMNAYWSEGGYLLEMRAAVPDLAAFEERLGWLTKVDSETWLEAMPAKVVKAADHDTVVREMLKGIPVPATFDPKRIPDEGVTTNRYQVGATVAGTVSCLWFRQWGQARRTGDEQAEAEAVKAMGTSRRWPILREMNADGDYPETIWQDSAAMPSGFWDWGPHHWRLLPHAEGLGCARWGIPVLPWKQRRQNERAEASGG